MNDELNHNIEVTEDDKEENKLLLKFWRWNEMKELLEDGFQWKQNVGLSSATVDPKHELVVVEAEAINELMDMHKDEGEKTTMELKMLKLKFFEEGQSFTIM